MPLIRRRKLSETDDVEPLHERAALLWLIAAPVVVSLPGFAIGSGAYIYCYLRRMDQLERWKALTAALIFSLFLYVLFDLVLVQPFYSGMLWPGQG